MSVTTMNSRFPDSAADMRRLRSLNRKGRLSLCLAMLGALTSCRQVFTTSLASWAARDPASMVPTVSPANVSSLVSLSENNPALALQVLKGIKDAVAQASTPEEKAALQNAAVTAAANASGIGSAILSNAGNITDSLSSGGDVVGVVSTAISGLTSLSETSALLKATLPSPDNKDEYDAYVKAASSESLANAAVVILAAQAQQEDGVEAYLAGFDPNNPASAEESLAIALAGSAADKYAAEGGTGPLADILGSLNLTTP